MSKKAKIVSNGVHHTAAEVGTFDLLNEYEVIAPLSGKPFPGKLFLSDVLKLTGLEVSLQTLPVGAGMPFSHKHRENEEFYLVIKGHGEFHVNETSIAVQEGSVIRIAPGASRSWKNTGNEPFITLCAQAAADSLKHFKTSDGVPV